MYLRYLKQESAQRFILHMEEKLQLPSLWQINDEVSVTFPGNGLLKKGKVIKVAFTAYSEPLYDVEIPYNYYDHDYDPGGVPQTSCARIHGLKEWHLRNPESPVADRVQLPKVE